MNLYVLRDKKSNTVAAPFAAPSDGVAMRLVMDALDDPKATIARYPKDFVVIYIGEYADDDGTLRPADVVRTLVEVEVLAESRK